jgi:signal transduction histidine kinase/putative methionine-R-sulfoxide reductase with GAF domain
MVREEHISISYSLILKKITRMQKEKLVTQAIKKISDVVSNENELKPLLQRIAKIAKEFLGLKSCTIWLYDSGKEQLILRGASGRHEVGVGKHFYKKGEGLTWYIFKNQMPFRLKQALDKKDIWKGKYVKQIYPDKIKTGGPFLGVPIIFKEECIGTLKFGTDNLRYIFTDEDLAFAQIIANEIAIAVNYLDSSYEVQKLTSIQNERLIFLSEFSNELQTCVTLEQIYELATRITKERLYCRTSSIFLFSKEGYLERKFISGFKRSNPPVEFYKRMQGFTGKTAGASANEFGHARMSNDMESEPVIQDDPVVRQYALNYEYAIKHEFGLDEKAKHIITVPLNGTNRTWGVLRVINKLDPQTGYLSNIGFTEFEKDWLLTIASLVSVAVSNIRKQNKLSKILEINRLLIKEEKEILGVIAKSLIDHTTNFQSCLIHIVDEVNGELHLKSSSQNFSRLKGVKKEDLRVNIGEGVVGKTFLSNKVTIIKNFKKDLGEFLYPDWLEMNHFISMICLPIQNIDRTMTHGTLSLFTRFEYEFDDDQIDYLTGFANQMSNILQNIREKKDLEFINKLSEKINQETRIKNIFKIVTYEIPPIIGFDGCVIMKNEPDYFEIIESPIKQQIGFKISKDIEIANDFGKNPGIMNFTNIQNDRRFDQVRSLVAGVNSILLIPIMAKRKNLYGAIVLNKFAREEKSNNVNHEYAVKETIIQSESDVNEDLCLTIANQVGTAIEKNELLDHINIEYEKKSIIEGILYKISSIENLSESLETILSDIVEILHADYGYIVWFSKNSKYVRPAHFYGISETNMPKLEVGVTGLMGWVYRNKRGYLWPGGEADHLYVKKINLDKEVKSELIAPLLYDNEVIGIINISSAKSKAFHENDLLFLQTLASETAIVIQNNQFHEAAIKLGEVRFDDMDKGSISETLAKNTADIMGTPAACVWLKSVEDGLQTLKLEGWHGVTIRAKSDLDMPEPQGGITWETIRKGTLNIIENIRDPVCGYKHPEFAKENDLESMISMPIKIGNEIFGAINTYANRQYRFFDKEKSLLKNLATSGAIALKNAELVAQLNAQNEQIQKTTEEIIDVVTQSSFYLITRQINHEVKNSLMELAFDLQKIQDYVLARSSKRQIKILKEQTQKIENNARRIENLLHIYKFKNRHIESVAVRELLESNVLIFQERNVDNPIFFDVHLEKELFIEGDKAELSVIIYNFLSNAIKAIRRAEREVGEIKISATKKYENIVIKIEDNGTGIKNEHENKIFEPYFTTTEGGVGLGLYVVHELVRYRYHGEIKFKSQYTKGTVFTILFPVN